MVLVIDTQSSNIVQVALRDGHTTIAIVEEENSFGSQSLLPLIVKLLSKNRITFNQIKAIEVARGPGSFTGLRVGASVGQALGLALQVPVNGLVNKPVKLRYTK